MKRMATMLVAAALAAAVAVPAVAFGADAVGTHVVSRVSGVEIARELLANVDTVDLGSTAATITMQVDGRSQPLRIDFGELGAGLGARGSGVNALTLALIPVAGSLFFRILRFLTHIGR